MEQKQLVTYHVGVHTANVTTGRAQILLTNIYMGYDLHVTLTYKLWYYDTRRSQGLFYKQQAKGVL